MKLYFLTCLAVRRYSEIAQDKTNKKEQNAIYASRGQRTRWYNIRVPDNGLNKEVGKHMDYTVIIAWPGLTEVRVSKPQ